MELRLVEIVLPTLRGDEFTRLLEEFGTVSSWHDTDAEGQVTLHLLLPAGQTEAAMDRIENRFGSREDLRIIVLPVEASIPRPPTGIESGAGSTTGESRSRVSREELYTAVTENLGTNPVYLAFTLLSALVAAIGLIRNDLAVIIGAMVIAPLLQPIVALALATTLGDLDLGRRALSKGLIGVIAAVGLAVLIGLLVPLDPTVPAIRARIAVDLSHVLLALAAGAAGTLAYTTGLSGAVIGVMVAVALMPPLVTAGLLLGTGAWDAALSSGLLTLVNIVCVNLAGVVTFLLQGVRPLRWWEANRARRATYVAITLWTLLLALLTALLWLSGKHG